MEPQSTAKSITVQFKPNEAHIAADYGSSQQSLPRLMRVSEVDHTCDPTSAMGTVLTWIRNFLACPHADLGRQGPVCPFVPTSLKLDTIWMAEMPDSSLRLEQICAVLNAFRDVFLSTPPIHGAESLNKAFLLVFSGLDRSGSGSAAIVDRVQATLKLYFVEMGLMIGEFHAKNESPGLHSKAFRPLCSPVPMLAIRHMVESDLPFMARDSYPPQQRAFFLRAYLFRLGGILSRSRFDEALKLLIAAELMVSSDPEPILATIEDAQ